MCTISYLVYIHLSTDSMNSVYGVGPTTASRILGKMQDTEKEFLNDRFEAKLKYVRTRPDWNEPQAKRRL
jgi:hypothetical protein